MAMLCLENTRHMLGSGGKCGSEQQAKHGPLAKCRRQRAASLHREGSGQAQASAEEAGEAQCGVSVEGERSRAVSTQENLDALRAEPDSLGEGPDARTGGPSCATQHRPHRGSRLCKMSIFFRADQRSRRSLHTSAPSVADASPNPDGFRLAARQSDALGAGAAPSGVVCGVPASWSGSAFRSPGQPRALTLRTAAESPAPPTPASTPASSRIFSLTYLCALAACSWARDAGFMGPKISPLIPPCPAHAPARQRGRCEQRSTEGQSAKKALDVRVMSFSVQQRSSFLNRFKEHNRRHK